MSPKKLKLIGTIIGIVLPVVGALGDGACKLWAVILENKTAGIAIDPAVIVSEIAKEM